MAGNLSLTLATTETYLQKSPPMRTHRKYILAEQGMNESLGSGRTIHTSRKKGAKRLPKLDLCVPTQMAEFRIPSSRLRNDCRVASSVGYHPHQGSMRYLNVSGLGTNANAQGGEQAWVLRASKDVEPLALCSSVRQLTEIHTPMIQAYLISPWGLGAGERPCPSDVPTVHRTVMNCPARITQSHSCF